MRVVSKHKRAQFHAVGPSCFIAGFRPKCGDYRVSNTIITGEQVMHAGV